MLNHSHGENFFPCIQSIIPCCNFQLSLVLPLCASEFVLLFFMTPLQENGSWILLSLLLWPLCPSVFSHGGIHGLLRTSLTPWSISTVKMPSVFSPVSNTEECHSLSCQISSCSPQPFETDGPASFQPPCGPSV